MSWRESLKGRAIPYGVATCKNASRGSKDQVEKMIGPTSVQRVGPTAGQASPGIWASFRLFVPVFASLLQNRRVAVLLVGIATLQIGLVAVKIHGWLCPIKAILGVPCPGCGLSTAIVLLLRGDYRAALSTHAFAPIFLAGLILTFVIAALPRRLRRKTVDRIAVFERRTGIVTFVLLGSVVYWGFRLVGLP